MRKIHQDSNPEKHFANLLYKYQQQKQQTEKINVIFGGFLHQDHYQTRNYQGAQRPLRREQFRSATSAVEQYRSVKIMFDTLVYILDSMSVFSFFRNFLFTVDFFFANLN